MNTLKLSKTPTGVYKIEIHTDDAVRMWDIQPAGMKDADVLMKFLQKKDYKYFTDWEISLVVDQKNFTDPEFSKAMQMALAYINERDNPRTFDFSF